MPAGSKVARSWTTWSSPRNSTVLPAERAEASGTSLPTGKSRSARIDSITSPTAPVAPTTATLKRREFGVCMRGPEKETQRGTGWGAQRTAAVFGGTRARNGRAMAPLSFRGRFSGDRRGRVAGLRPPSQRGDQVVHGQGGHRAAGRPAGAAGVRRQHHVAQRQQPGVDRRLAL